MAQFVSVLNSKLIRLLRLQKSTSNNFEIGVLLFYKLKITRFPRFPRGPFSPGGPGGPIGPGSPRSPRPGGPENTNYVIWNVIIR